MLNDGLYNLLTTNPAVAAALGIGSREDGFTGVFPVGAPDEPAVPYIVYQQVAREVINGYQGPNRLQFARYSFSCYGSPFKAVKTLAESVKLLLDGFTGKLSDGTIVGNTLPDSEVDGVEQMLNGSIWSVVLDYTFVFVDNGS